MKTKLKGGGGNGRKKKFCLIFLQVSAKVETLWGEWEIFTKVLALNFSVLKGIKMLAVFRALVSREKQSDEQKRLSFF